MSLHRFKYNFSQQNNIEFYGIQSDAINFRYVCGSSYAISIGCFVVVDIIASYRMDSARSHGRRILLLLDKRRNKNIQNVIFMSNAYRTHDLIMRSSDGNLLLINIFIASEPFCLTLTHSIFRTSQFARFTPFCDSFFSASFCFALLERVLRRSLGPNNIITSVSFYPDIKTCNVIAMARDHHSFVPPSLPQPLR